jgi:nucleoside-diphosphate-sugar epimerase
VLPRFAAAALAGEPLWVFDDGLQVRSFVHINSFVSCLIKLVLSRQAWTSDRSVINVGAPRATTILDLAKTVLAEADSASPIQFKPFEAVYPGKKDVRYRFPAAHHMESLIGPVEWPSVREIVHDVLSALRPHPEKAGALSPAIHGNP